jgi:hypothetical protein
MYVNRSFVWLLVAAASALPCLAAPIPIPVTNGSFEIPDVLNQTNGNPSAQVAAGGAQTIWQYTSQLATTSSIHFYGNGIFSDPIPYWTVSTSNNNNLVYGISNSISSQFYGTNGGADGGFTGLSANTDYTFNTLATQASGTALGYQYADGYQTAYANLAVGGTVTLAYNPADPNTNLGTGLSLGNFVAGDNYTVSAAIGTALNSASYQYNYSVILTDNGAPVATSSGLSPATASGDWLQATAAYTALDNGPIGVELMATNTDGSATVAFFDNVLVTDLGPANAPPSPEPATMSLLALAVVPLVRRRK